MTVLQLIFSNPCTSCFLAVCIVSIVGTICRTIFVVHNRYHRHRNIQVFGYPPEHCDADGDFKPEKKENDEDRCKRI